MRNKILFILGFLIILLAVTGFLVYLVLEQGPIAPGNQLGAVTGSETQPEAKSEEPAQEPKNADNYTTLVKPDFTLNFPSSWLEITQSTSTWPVVIINLQEEITNEKAKAINFQTNLSINRAELGEVPPQDYIENVKNGLINTIPIIEIVKQEKDTIDNRDAYFLEVDSIQEDLNFKTFLVFTVDEKNTIWALSFNTLKESWPDYQEVFYQMAKSFKIK